MSTRPKDMTNAERHALPEENPLTTPWWGIDEGQPDDLAIWIDSAGRYWRFFEDEKGRWFKVPVGVTRC